MSKHYHLFLFSLIFVLLAAGGFFIGQNNYIWAAENLIHDGVKNNYPTWQYANVTTSVDRLVLNTATSTLTSPNIALLNCQSAAISYSIQTYYGVGTTSIIQISIDHQDGIDLVDIKQPLSSTMAVTTTDLTAYCGQTIKIIFATPFADGRKGARLDDINLVITSANQPPVAMATSSVTEADIGEEIIFDGRDSTDDGQIIEWYWDFGDGHSIYASTTSYTYNAGGTYNIYLGVTDDLGLITTSSPLNILITSSTATATPTSTPQAINPDDLVINEVYPAPPAGENEWVEIYNPTTSTVDLAELYLLNIDAGKFVTTTLSGLIGPGGYVVIEDIAGSLNNSGDTIILRNNSMIISQTIYGDFPDSQKGDSWARGADGNFAKTITATKGAANVLTPIPAVSNNSSGGGSAAIKSTADLAEATTTATSTLPAVDYSGLIIINEIYPNPPGSDNDDEFIELYNFSTGTIDLTHFVLADASQNKHAIKASTTATSTNLIQPGGYFVLKRSVSNIALNNTGVETVKLYSPDLQLIDQVEYLGENKEGVSYSRSDDAKWRWVKTPTPSVANSDDELYPDVENPALLGDLAAAGVKLVGVVKAAAKTGKAISDTTLEQLGNFSANDQVRVRGVVSVLPGVLGSQYFYLAGSGAQIYCSKKDFPDLQIGDYIEVIGTLSDFSSVGRRIKISSRDQIKFIEHQTPPEPHQITAADVGEEYDSSLVTLSGEVLEIKSRNIIIDDGSGEAKVYLNSAINLQDLSVKPGDKITVTGVVNKSTSGYRVMPRDLKDIVVQAGQVKGDFTVAPAESSNLSIWYLGAIVAFLLAVIGILVWKLRKNIN